MANLSPAQQKFIDTLRRDGKFRTPFTGGRGAGRVASAWHRTAKSLEAKGLIKLSRCGDALEATPNRWRCRRCGAVEATGATVKFGLCGVCWNK